MTEEATEPRRPRVLVELPHLETVEAAEKMAEDIQNAGGIHYTDASGSEVNVTVGDVSVEV